MFSWPRTRMARSVSSPPCAPSGRPGRAGERGLRLDADAEDDHVRRVFAVLGGHRADPAVLAGEDLGDLGAGHGVMPSPFIASCTRRPMSGSRVAIGCSPRSRTVTSQPRRAAPRPSPRRCIRRRPRPPAVPCVRSSGVQQRPPVVQGLHPVHPGRVDARAAAGRTGRAPVAMTRSSKPVQRSAPPSSSRTRTRCPATSISVTSVRMRTSMSRARCSSGVRATRSSRAADVAADPVRDAAGRVRREVAALEGEDLQLVRPLEPARLGRGGHPRRVAPDDHQPFRRHAPSPPSTVLPRSTLRNTLTGADRFSPPRRPRRRPAAPAAPRP